MNSILKRIDAHHHFWSYDPIQYPWIDETKQCLKQDFLPPRLHEICQAQGLDAVISVQARQTIEETRWLLQFAEQHEWIIGVVGWVPLRSERVQEDLEPLAHSSRLKAVRHVVQDEPDDRFMLQPEFVRGVQALQQYDLAYDLLIYPHQLPAAIELVDRCPNQRFILDHIAKPHVTVAEFDRAWHQQFIELSKRPHVWCKFSGVLTEVRDPSWDLDTLRPYWDAAWKAFGPERLMYGSDWPVSTLRGEYPQWLQAVEQLTVGLSDHELQQFWNRSASAAYRLDA